MKRVAFCYKYRFFLSLILLTWMLTVLIFNKNVEAACTQDEYGGQCVEYVRNYFGGSYELMPGLCQYDPDCVNSISRCPVFIANELSGL